MPAPCSAPLRPPGAVHREVTTLHVKSRQEEDLEVNMRGRLIGVSTSGRSKKLSGSSNAYSHILTQATHNAGLLVIFSDAHGIAMGQVFHRDDRLSNSIVLQQFNLPHCPVQAERVQQL